MARIGSVSVGWRDPVATRLAAVALSRATRKRIGDGAYALLVAVCAEDTPDRPGASPDRIKKRRGNRLTPGATVLRSWIRP